MVVSFVLALRLVSLSGGSGDLGQWAAQRSRKLQCVSGEQTDTDIKIINIMIQESPRCYYVLI